MVETTESLSKPDIKPTRRDVLKWVAIASAGVAGAYVGHKIATKEKKIDPPEGTIDDPKNHILYSKNFGSENAQSTTILVTGSPERAPELSSTNKTTLKEVFENLPDNTALAQVWTGLDIKNNSRHLQNALDLANGPVDLVVFSSGFYSLKNLPQEYWNRIGSLTIHSPMTGIDSLKDKAYKAGLQIFGKPFFGISTQENIFQNITPFISHLQENGVSIQLHLGNQEQLLNNRTIASGFQKKFGIAATYQDRNHSPSPQALLETAKE